MYLVALAELSGTLDDEAPALARDLGLGAYEARLLLAGERPKVLLRTPDQDRARALLAALRGRKHGAIAFDARAIVPTDEMISPGRFSLTDTALVAERGDELPWTDVLAVLRAVRSQQTTTTEVVKERKLAVGAALASGGLVLSKKTSREVVKREETREQLLYLVRRSGAKAWVLREHGAHFEGLGSKMAPSAAENLVRFAAEVRSRAPDAAYDERLLRFHASGDGLGADGRLDEQVHALALAIARLGRSPYR